MNKSNRIIVIMIIFVFTFVLSSCNSNKGVLVQDEKWDDMIKNGAFSDGNGDEYMRNDLIILYWSFIHEVDAEFKQAVKGCVLPNDKSDYSLFERKSSKYIGLYVDEGFDNQLKEKGKNLSMLFFVGTSHNIYNVLNDFQNSDIIVTDNLDFTIYSYEFDDTEIPFNIQKRNIADLFQIVTYETTSFFNGEKREVNLIKRPRGKVSEDNKKVLIDKNSDNGFYDEFLGMVKDSDYIFVTPGTLINKIEYVDGVKCIIDYEYKTFYEEIQYKEPYYREYYDFIEEFIVKEEVDIKRKCYIDYEKYISALLSYESISNHD